jgi:hypothetical protein
MAHLNTEKELELGGGISFERARAGGSRKVARSDSRMKLPESPVQPAGDMMYNARRAHVASAYTCCQPELNKNQKQTHTGSVSGVGLAGG